MRTAAALALALLLTGCSDAVDSAKGAVDTATKVKDCAGLATDLAQSGLAGTPSQAEAEATARKLQDRVASLDSQEVKDAAATLTARLQELRTAVAAKKPAEVQAAVTRAQQAARDAAETCGIPVGQLVPGL